MNGLLGSVIISGFVTLAQVAPCCNHGRLGLKELPFERGSHFGNLSIIQSIQKSRGFPLLSIGAAPPWEQVL